MFLIASPLLRRDELRRRPQLLFPENTGKNFLVFFTVVARAVRFEIATRVDLRRLLQNLYLLSIIQGVLNQTLANLLGRPTRGRFQPF